MVNAWAHPRSWYRVGKCSAVALLLAAAVVHAQTPLAAPAGPFANFGPYNVTFLAGGIGLSNPLSPDSPVLPAGAAWSMSGWLRPDRSSDTPVIVAALGDTAPDGCRCLMLQHGERAAAGVDVSLRATHELTPGAWHAVAATYDGHRARLYLDGSEVAAREAVTGAVAPMFRLAPESVADLTGQRHFGGSLAWFLLQAGALDAAGVGRLAAQRPDFQLVYFHQVGVGWPWQEKAGAACSSRNPPGPCRMAMRRSPPPVRSPTLAISPALQPDGAERWSIGMTPGAGAAGGRHAGADIEPGISRARLVHRRSTRHRTDFADRQRRVSGSGLRTEQSRHPRVAESPGLLVSQRIRSCPHRSPTAS